jgi:hypothetical protein
MITDRYTTFTIKRDTIIRCANACGLGGLLMLLSVQLHTYGGTCGASARQLAATARVHPTTAAKHLHDLANGGFVKEQRSAGRVWRRIVQSGDGHVIKIDSDALKLCNAGDVLAMAVLLEALADRSGGVFRVAFTKLAALAACSVNTAKRLLREAETQELATVRKSGWGEVQIVPVGTIRQKTERVHSANAASDKWAAIAAKAAAALQRGV